MFPKHLLIDKLVLLINSQQTNYGESSRNSIDSLERVELFEVI